MVPTGKASAAIAAAAGLPPVFFPPFCSLVPTDVLLNPKQTTHTQRKPQLLADVRHFKREDMEESAARAAAAAQHRQPPPPSPPSPSRAASAAAAQTDPVVLAARLAAVGYSVKVRRGLGGAVGGPDGGGGGGGGGVFRALRHEFLVVRGEGGYAGAEFLVGE